MTEPTPADPAGQPTTEPEAGDPPKPESTDSKTTSEPKSDDFKSEESKKAVLADLAKERDARKALEARFEKLGEAFGVSKPENGKTDIDQLTERLSKHEEELATERQARWRAEVAHEKGLTEAQAARLQGTTRDELASDADSLKELFTAAPAASGTPKPDPSQGARGPVDLNAQIAAAEKEGDHKLAIRLKSQQLLKKN